MAQPSIVNGLTDPIIQHLLRRLERVEKRLRTLEREKRRMILPHHRLATFSQQFSEHISITGLKEAASAKSVSLKLIWILFFFVCLGCMGFFVYKTFREYLNEPTATKVKLVEQKQYDYPTILLCPDTWLDADKALHDGLSLGGLQYGLGFLINYFVNPPPYRIDNYDQAQLDFNEYYIRRNFTDLVHFFKWISLDSEEFFYHCPFCRNQTSEKIIMSDAICYHIPMHATPGNAPIVSSLDTLEVVVPDRSRDLLRRKSHWRLFLGLDLLLGEATRRHAEIYPHQTNTIQFVTHRFVSVNTPDNPCIDDTEAPKNYSYARCVLQCYIERYEGQLFLMTACASSTSDCDNSMLTPNRTHQFYTADLWEQLASIQENEKGEEAPEHCYTRCPSFCERMIYTMDVQSHKITPIIDLSLGDQSDQKISDSDFRDQKIGDFDFLDHGELGTEILDFHDQNESKIRNSDFPDQNNSKIGNSDFNDQRDHKIRNSTPPIPKRRTRGVGTPTNLTRISFLNSAAVYGGVLTFEEVSTYSFETMVGNVGGMLSLWTGISIMSFIQVLMFLITSWYSKRIKTGRCLRASSTYDCTFGHESHAANKYFYKANIDGSSIV